MQLKRRVLLAIAAASFFSRAALAVEGGSEDRATSHAVAIARGDPSASGLRCSGTLISANVVLTVRHCIASVTPGTSACDATLGEVRPEEASSFWVNVSPWTGAGSSWKRVAATTVPEPRRLCGDDIALLTLDAPVNEAEGVPAKPVLDEATFLSLARARQLGLAAFGATHAETNDVGVRRSRFDIPIGCVPGQPGFACGKTLDLIDLREFTTNGGGCRGDSGGGALSLDDRKVVFGVLSRGDRGLDETTCTLGVFERTDVWAWLIARNVIQSATPSSPAPSWATDLFPARPKLDEFCSGNGSCGDAALCISTDGRRSFHCAERCADDGACAAGRHCESGACVPTPVVASTEPRGGCTVGTAGSVGLASPSLFVRALTVALGCLALAAKARRVRQERRKDARAQCS